MLYITVAGGGNGCNREIILYNTSYMPCVLRATYLPAVGYFTYSVVTSPFTSQTKLRINLSPATGTTEIIPYTREYYPIYNKLFMIEFPLLFTSSNEINAVVL